MLRKKLKDSLDSVQSLKARYLRQKNILEQFIDEPAMNQIIEQFDQIISKATSELKKLPIGYLYSGTFYIKTPYSNNFKFEKIDGEAFMREDLISWEITPYFESPMPGYHRAIYQQPENLASEITRLDAKPIYERNTDEKAAIYA